jgi:FXSXX-COOH protein
MPCAIGWVFRTAAFFTRAEGTYDQLIAAFEHSPLRVLEGEALVRHAIADGWLIRDVHASRGNGSPLTRIVATGHNGEASILFEVTGTPDAALRELRAAAVGRTLRRVVDSITTAGHE